MANIWITWWLSWLAAPLQPWSSRLPIQASKIRDRRGGHLSPCLPSPRHLSPVTLPSHALQLVICQRDGPQQTHVAAQFR